MSVPLKAFLLVIKNFTRGKNKRDDSNSKQYGHYGWRDTENAREVYLDALHRHFMAYSTGTTIDSDSKLSHMVGVACNALILLDLEEAEKEVNEVQDGEHPGDDRPPTGTNFDSAYYRIRQRVLGPAAD